MKNKIAGSTPQEIAGTLESENLFNRRQWLRGVSALIIASLTGSVALKALAAASTTDGFNAFMTLSKVLTDRQNLNTDVGQRLFNALEHMTPHFSAQIPTLSGAIASGALNQQQEAQALLILQAWYLGTVNKQIITYEHALVFDACKDVLTIRSYCLAEPGFWATKPVEGGA
jgi:hypothetical protein